MSAAPNLLIIGIGIVGVIAVIGLGFWFFSGGKE